MTDHNIHSPVISNVVHRRLASVDPAETIHVVDYEVEHPRAIAVFSHGFFVPGFESNRMFVVAARAFQTAGIRAVLFDYRGSGYSDGSFIDVRLGQLQDDLRQVYNAYRSQSTPTVVVGQSLGSGLAALTAAELPDLAGLVLWGFSAHNYERYTRQYLRDASSEVVYQGNGFPVTQAFVNDFRTQDPMDAVAEVHRPVLFVHGTADDKASIELPREAVARRSAPSRLVEIPGGTHGFKAQPDELARAIDVSIEWVLNDPAISGTPQRRPAI